MNETRPKILVIDDEEGMRDSIRVLLARSDFDVLTAVDGEEGLRLMAERGPFDAVLCDLRMPGLDGLGVVERAAAAGVTAPIIIMSAYGTIDLAVTAMQKGAFSFVSKPFKTDEVVVALRKALDHFALVDENRRLREEKSRHFRFEELVGRDEKMQAVFDAVRKIAPYKTSVLITGESGTGKELVARSIHRLSDRADEAFVAINCGAIPETLLESELFGHVRGAFTDARRDKSGLFTEAHGGTLFLDEIGETPLHLQVKLLRALQDEEIRPVGGTQSRKVDVRIVAATKQDLERTSGEGTFREDLYYRLSVFPIHIPPLRDRPGDIPLLVEHFLSVHRNRLGVRLQGVREKAMALLMEYLWPGNVRELENVIERAVVLAGGGFLDPGHLPERVRERTPVQSTEIPQGMPVAGGDLSVKHNKRFLESLLIRKALEKTRGNRTSAAKILEISHRALIYKLQEYGLEDL